MLPYVTPRFLEATRPIRNVFLFLGADPTTDWLADCGVALDDNGFIVTGARKASLESSVPGGQNVEFVSLGPGPEEVTMRVWERGVGETLACGTGAAAASVAMRHWGRVGRKVTVHQPGGDAEVEVRADGTVVLSGPSQRIATCAVEVELR